MAKNATLELGSISAGTCKAEDLADALIWNLEHVDLTIEHIAAVEWASSRLEELQSDDTYNEPTLGAGTGVLDQTEILDNLINVAQGYLPDYCYLGMHENDGADFGVWVISELFEDTTQGGFDGSVYRSTTATNSIGEHVPAAYSHYLAINDHGNCTLWTRDGDTWKECWAIV